MKISSEELKKEVLYLKETLKILKNIIEKESGSIEIQKTNVNEMKKYIWENSGVLDDIEVMVSMRDVNKEVDFTNKNIKNINALKKSLSSPYFGRVDFFSDDDIISVYIGINGINENLKNYVFDWRSPISSLFYNYGVGKAEYTAPMGKIQGDILLKRQYKIFNGKIKKLSYADLLPLMYINFELNGYPNAKTIKHVIIDEAQDYTLLQFDVLKKIFNSASFTILGDVNQTINPFYKYNNLNDINSIFNNKGKYIELTKTYRSSQEIIEFSNNILGIDNACSVRHSNSIPVEFREVDKNEIRKILVENVHKMQEQNMKRIAIITKSNEEVINLYNELKKDLTKLKMINNSEDFKIGNLVILPSYISKGLEFDGVIIYTDKENEYQEKDKYLFYVVCTRAQHALSIYNQKNIVKNK